MNWSGFLTDGWTDLLVANVILLIVVSLWRCGLAAFVHWRYPDDRSKTAFLLNHFQKISEQFDPGFDRKSIQKWSSNHWGFLAIQLISITSLLHHIREPGFNVTSAGTLLRVAPTFALAGFEAYFIVSGKIAERLFCVYGVESLSELEVKFEVQGMQPAS